MLAAGRGNNRILSALLVYRFPSVRQWPSRNPLGKRDCIHGCISVPLHAGLTDAPWSRSLTRNTKASTGMKFSNGAAGKRSAPYTATVNLSADSLGAGSEFEM